MNTLTTNMITIQQVTINTDNEYSVDARNLHTFLEVGKDFSTWIKGRIEKYDFLEGEDYIVIHNQAKEVLTDFGKYSKGGRPRIDYLLTINMAKELSMAENNVKGKEARKYFIEMERVAIRSVQQPKLPTTFKEALICLVEAEEVKEQQALQIAQLEYKVHEDAPKVAFTEAVANTSSSMTMQEFAAIAYEKTGLGRNKLYSKLRELGVLLKGNIPSRQYLHHFNVIPMVNNQYCTSVTLIQTASMPYLLSLLTA